MLDRAIELAGVVAHPVEIFFARAGIDDEQVVVFAQAVDDDVVDERSLGIEQRRILRLADGEPGGVVHRDVLHGGERVRPGHADVAHVADVKDADARCAPPCARRQCRTAIDAGYSTGMSQPLNSTIFAPIWRWTGFRAVLRTFGGDGRSGFSNRHEEPRSENRSDSGWAAGIWN